MKNSILALDGMNLFHRARSGFQAGDHFVTYNFFRSLRALIGQFNPSRCCLALEGKPHKRLNLFPDYKANRVMTEGTEEYDKFLAFIKQRDEIVDMLEKYFPISVIKHPDFEADDTIYNVIKRSVTSVPWTVISTDTDFIQLLDEFKHVTLYNPVKKTYVEAHSVDYVAWKALRGDVSDNIPGLISDAKALELLQDPHRVALEQFFKDSDHAKTFNRNWELVKFAEWNDDERNFMTSSEPKRNWDAVAALFDKWEFKSILKEGAWQKFTETFDPLFG